MGVYIRVGSRTVYVMAMADLFGTMVITILEVTSRIRGMGKGSMCGMERGMKGSMPMDRRMGKARLSIQINRPMKVNGRIINVMALGYILIRSETGMKVNLKMM